MLISYIIIFILAAIPFFEVMVIIPFAIVGGLPVVPVMIVAFLGNLLTLGLLIVFIEKIKSWRRKKKGDEAGSKRHKRAKGIWDKYGLPGLAFVGPFFIGTHLTALLASVFGSGRKRTFYLMTASLLFWTIVLGLAAHYGFDFFISDKDDEGFIMKLIER